jgi:DNA-binding NtrC family response regulator
MMSPPQILLVAAPERRRAFLEAAGDLAADFHSFEHCQDARRFLATRPNIDLAVADLTLPDGNWWNICDELIHAGHPTPVVVLLEHPTKDTAELVRHGACGVLQPPYTQDDVCRAVGSALAKRAAPWEAVPA